MCTLKNIVIKLDTHTGHRLTLLTDALPTFSISMSYSVTHIGFCSGGPNETRAEWGVMSVTSKLVGGPVAVENYGETCNYYSPYSPPPYS